MSTPFTVMIIGDGMALLIIVQNDDGDDPRHYGSLVALRSYIINDSLQRHNSLTFYNALMMPPLVSSIRKRFIEHNESFEYIKKGVANLQIFLN